MSDAWGAPGTEAVGSGGGTPLPAGGTEAMDVAGRVWEDLKAYPAGYVGAGLAYVAVSFVLIGVAVGWMVVWMLPLMLGADETLGALAGLVGFGGYTLLVFAIAFLAIPVMAASLMRALEVQRRGGPAIGFSSLFSTARQDAGRVIVYYVLVNVLATIGMFFLYVPGLIVFALAMFALPMVVLERRTLPETAAAAWEHGKNHPGWHCKVWGLLLLVVIGLELSVVGLAVAFPVVLAWSLFAYRAAFGETGAPGARDGVGRVSV